jgi:4-hydroxybenzoate polyprenyltransferase
VVTFVLFVLFGLWTHLAWPWYFGLVLTAGAFAYQHVVVTPSDLSKVNRAFFTANGFVGIALFLFGAVSALAAG